MVIYEDFRPALEAEGEFEDVDLVIADLVMPMPGDELLMVLIQRQIKIPVVILSAHLSDGVLELLDLMRAASVVEKPISLLELTEAIDPLLGEIGVEGAYGPSKANSDHRRRPRNKNLDDRYLPERRLSG